MKNDLSYAIDNTVSISELNRGKARKIFEEVKKNGPKLVIKNNKPEAVIMSPEEYSEMIEEIENIDLLQMVLERLVDFDKSLIKTEDEIYSDLNISKEDLGDFLDVEFD